MKEELIKKIENILKEIGVENPRVVLDYPTQFTLGDLSTNVAMSYAKQLGKNPMDLAEEITNKLEDKKIKNISKIEVVKPGFINFFFDAEYFSLDVKENSSNQNKIFSGKKTIVEYTDLNPFNEFNIGHLMPNVIGESISRIVQSLGAEVKRANYQSDVGLHVAKAIWAIKNGANLKGAYSQGHKAYEEDETAKKEIVEINKKIYDKSDSEINEIYEKGRKESLDGFEEIYKRVGTKFDFYFFESEVASFGKAVVEKNIGKIFEKGDEGAVIFKGENFDKKLHTRVFINKEGLPTYEAKEIGLSKIKYDKYSYDVSIVVTGHEINEYFKELLMAM